MRCHQGGSVLMTSHVSGTGVDGLIYAKGLGGVRRLFRTTSGVVDSGSLGVSPELCQTGDVVSPVAWGWREGTSRLRASPLEVFGKDIGETATVRSEAAEFLLPWISGGNAVTSQCK